MLIVTISDTADTVKSKVINQTTKLNSLFDDTAMFYWKERSKSRADWEKSIKEEKVRIGLKVPSKKKKKNCFMPYQTQHTQQAELEVKSIVFEFWGIFFFCLPPALPSFFPRRFLGSLKIEGLTW